MSAYTDNQNELFDTYTETGEKLRPQQRGHVHANGIWHCAVNVMLYRSTGELVLQQRSASKRVCPLRWDLSVAEHLQVGEDWLTAAQRGLAEELGLCELALDPCGPEIQERHNDPSQGIRNYEFQRCYSGVSDLEITIDPVEVAAVRSIDLSEFAREVTHDPKKFTPWLLRWAQTLQIISTR